MIRLRWTPAASADLENIAEYLFEKTPNNAAPRVRRIYEAPTVLTTHPNHGRPGRKPGTRELVIPELPYIVVYEVTHDVVHMLRILHSAQRW